MSRFLDKCRKQKTVSAHLVVSELEKEIQRFNDLEKKYKELQHYSNKHQQLMKTEIKKLKAINQKLREKKD